MNQEQLNKIRNAYESESPELGALLKQSGISPSDLDLLRNAYESEDDATFGRIVKSYLSDGIAQGSPEDLASNSPETATEEGVLWEDYLKQEKDKKYSETLQKLIDQGFKPEEAEQLLASMPRLMSGVASGEKMGVGSIIGNTLQDFGSGAGRVIGSGYNALVNGENFNQSMSDVSGDNGVQEFLRSPATPISMALGGVANPLGKFGMGVAQKMSPILRLFPKKSTAELVGMGALGGGLVGATDYGLQKGSQAVTNLTSGELTNRELPSLKQAGIEGGLSALTGGLLGGGANYLLNRPTAQTFKASEPTQNINARINQAFPSTEDVGLRSSLSEDIIRKQSGLDKNTLNSPEFSNQLVRNYAKTPQDLDKINAYNKEITESPLGAFSPLEKRGTYWLERYVDKIDEFKSTAGKGMGDIEKGRLGKSAIVSQGDVMGAWSKLLTDKIGLMPRFSKDGELISFKKLDNSIVDEGDELYKKIFKQTETILKDSKNGMSGDALRGLEKRLRLKKETVSETGQSQKYYNTMEDFQRFTKEKVFDALRKNGATKEELKAYQDHRQDYYDWMKKEDEFTKTAGDLLEMPENFIGDKKAIYKNASVFMNRLVNTLGHGNARQIGSMMKDVLKEDPFADAVHIKMAMESANLGSQSGGGITKSGRWAQMIANAVKSEPDVTNKTAELVSEMAKTKKKDVNLNFGKSQVPSGLSGLGTMASEPSSLGGSKKNKSKLQGKN